ncbi:type B 50S ribosomal protein L31 [bacterium]|nr:MAG: type B 50S ribosomal protein L31 [bacterium]
MKKGIHPELKPVVLVDLSTGTRFETVSTASTREMTTLENGTEAGLMKLDITSASHPFYTGKKTILDVAGRVDRFNSRRVDGGTPAAKSGRR